MIKHVLADGTILQDIRGHTVPITQATAPAYRIVAGLLQNHKPEPTRQEGRRGA